MAGAARLPPGHIGHRVGRIVFGEDVKNIIVAGRAITPDRFEVIIVAECYLSDRFSLERNLVLDPAGIGRRCQRDDQHEQKQVTEFHDFLHQNV